MKVEQIIVHRISTMVDEGTMGFSDWTMRKETMEEFVQRVTNTMNQYNTIYVSYPNEDMAIIQYWTNEDI